MQNENKHLQNLKEKIDISPNSSSHFDELYNNDDILTYSESKSQSTIYLNKNSNNDYLINYKNQSLKNILISQEEISKEKNVNNNVNNNTESSALQISLSNILSDNDNKEKFFFINNKIQNNKESNKNNFFIDISNDVSNNNENENDNNYINNIINTTLNKKQNDDQSSVCNYSKSTYNNPINNKDNNFNKIVFTSPGKKSQYQIEKGANINLSVTKNNKNNINKARLFIQDNDYNNSLSINKAHNFTITNTINTKFNLTENSYTSPTKKAKIGMNKNKIKLIIKNKNIDANNQDTKKFFYNPKRNVHNKIIKRNNDDLKTKNNKTKLEITEIKLVTNPNFNINNTTINNEKNIQTAQKKTNGIYKKLINIKNNSSNKKSDKGNILIKKKKLFYLNKTKNKDNVSAKEKNKTYNNYIVDSSKIKKKKLKLSAILSKDLMQKLKTEQKKTTNQLLNKINEMNNVNHMNNNIDNHNAQIINFLPIFRNVFETKINANKNAKFKTIPEDEKIPETNSIDSSNKIKTKNKISDSNINNNISNNNISKKIKSKINLSSLLNNFNIDRNKKKHKSIFNFGNIFFINQNQNQGHKKAETEIFIKNSIKMKQKPKIITDFSSYKKINKNNDYNRIDTDRIISTEIDVNSFSEKLKNDNDIKI